MTRFDFEFWNGTVGGASFADLLTICKFIIQNREANWEEMCCKT